MILQTRLANPSAALQPYMGYYGQSQGRIDTEPLVVPQPARPKQLATFFFGDPYHVLVRTSGVCETPPS